MPTFETGFPSSDPSNALSSARCASELSTPSLHPVESDGRSFPEASGCTSVHVEEPSRLRRLYLPSHVSFREVRREDYPLLYRLLVERYETGASNIQGRALERLPSYDEHVAHLDRRPYRRIAILRADGVDAGMWYVSHENVGACFVLAPYVSRGLGLAACFLFLQECTYPVYAYVHPKHRPGRRTVERLGFALVEEQPQWVRYELPGPPLNPFAAYGHAASGGSLQGPPCSIAIA